MDWWLILLIGAGAIVLGAIAVRRGWVDLSDKTKRGKPSGAAVVMIGDEVFAPRKYEAQVEMDRQARLPVPGSVAGPPTRTLVGTDDPDDEPPPGSTHNRSAEPALPTHHVLAPVSGQLFFPAGGHENSPPNRHAV